MWHYFNHLVLFYNKKMLKFKELYIVEYLGIPKDLLFFFRRGIQEDLNTLSLYILGA